MSNPTPTIPRTSLSVGLLVKAVLSADAGVTSMVGTKIFPSVSETSVNAPYVCYQRTGTQEEAAKGFRGADSCTVRCDCFGRTYEESVALAELVRAALETTDGPKEGGGLKARSIIMSDASDEFTDQGSGIYYQQVAFTVRIN